jgi:photosynthetic reaction center H subunit
LKEKAMSTGAITAHIDVAQVVLYMFWVFFAGLVIYLHGESKREGYPLQYDDDGRSRRRGIVQGFPAMPPPKTFRLADGSTRQAPPGLGGDDRPLNAERSSTMPGAPWVPIGNPLLAGVGPGAWAERPDVPDKTCEGGPRLLPLRGLPEFGVDSKDPDPRGWPVRGADQAFGGTVVDLWVDVAEMLFRYIEVEVDGGRHVLLPMNFARIADRQVKVNSILGAQFSGVPGTAKPDVVTMLEEEKVMAYYGAGTLYATPERAEPLI